MKTKSIAQAGMLCAVYGVMIFANTLTGLWVGSLFPYLFAFPILICAIQQTPQVSLCALVAMFILTLMLGSLTTWLIAGSMLGLSVLIEHIQGQEARSFCCLNRLYLVNLPLFGCSVVFRRVLLLVQ